MTSGLGGKKRLKQCPISFWADGTRDGGYIPLQVDRMPLGMLCQLHLNFFKNVNWVLGVLTSGGGGYRENGPEAGSPPSLTMCTEGS